MLPLGAITFRSLQLREAYKNKTITGQREVRGEEDRGGQSSVG
jgi:hypothetical protein